MGIYVSILVHQVLHVVLTSDNLQLTQKMQNAVVHIVKLVTVALLRGPIAICYQFFFIIAFCVLKNILFLKIKKSLKLLLTIVNVSIIYVVPVIHY